MINKWILDNFKSIDKEKELKFRPLTIFTGANSSGKSTVLQSILLVTQTIQSSNASRSVVLNGTFKKFGSYSDVVNKRDLNKNIEIGFTLDDNSEGNNPRSAFLRREFGAQNIDCRFVISSGQKDDNLNPVLESLRLEMATEKAFKTTVDIKKDEGMSAQNKKILDMCKEQMPYADYDYSINMDSSKKHPFMDTRFQWKFIGVNMRHFLPSYLIGYCSSKEYLKYYLCDYLMSGSGYYYYDRKMPDETAFLAAIKDKAIQIADAIYKEGKYRSKTFEKAYAQIHNRFTLSKLQQIFRGCTLDTEEKMKYVKQLQEKLSSLPEGYVTETLPIMHHPVVETVADFFTERINYLGPLREEPKSLYPLEGNGSIDNVGLKGEYTAFVFDNNKSKLINYISTESFKDLTNLTLVEKTATLAEAINEWLVYLGVANAMNTNDKGKIGHELKIVTDVPDLQQDLTHVGVGVSQVLPILVLAFLANEGDVLILEQPELHLHPKVQTRLADFFVSMNAVGKQCIIETHSEYLINRLRLLVAKSDDTKISDETMIYFVEKDKEEGYSKYREITINPYGKIDHWPDGFFDEGEDLASQIVRASFEKKKREKLKAEK